MDFTLIAPVDEAYLGVVEHHENLVMVTAHPYSDRSPRPPALVSALPRRGTAGPRRLAGDHAGRRHTRPMMGLRQDPDRGQVPLRPNLVALLRRHIEEFGTTPDGRIFRSTTGGAVRMSTYLTAWRRARQQALTPAEAASPLARRPYDLRHAAVSRWLNAGVPPTQVAEWAGHSVRVLLTAYAKCIVGSASAGSATSWVEIQWTLARSSMP
ncbi:hypothetical protein BCD48_27325 [Pseudofrankia sp. BMG5.36]|nr:tyrosine-type recombinase/integrase [Pseudofrankia sp. BMG5.36]OHV43690.1 hypothetical protein BCD48_27325 [Pseudofrankia sp. BMG5.36]